MPKIVDKDAVRLQIIHAFQRLSDTRPLTAISLREIAAEAGMSHTSVLRYFHDKTALQLACARYASGCLKQTVSEWFAAHPRSTFESDRAYLDAFLAAVLLQKDNGVKPRDVVMTCALGAYSAELHAAIQKEYHSLGESMTRTLASQLGRPLSEMESYTLLILFSGIYFAGFNEIVPEEHCSPISGILSMLEIEE